ncbi:hypothetical protein PMAYCL1PPCAC_08742, partial [Pristionchus mayeri]
SWLAWLEIAYAAPACIICCLLFALLTRIPLSRGCKCFLYINTASLFAMALLQCLIAEWTLRNNRGIGQQELLFFPLVFIHQFFYGLSGACLLNLALERLLLCFYPTFYETHHLWRLLAVIAAAIITNLIYPTH